VLVVVVGHRHLDVHDVAVTVAVGRRGGGDGQLGGRALGAAAGRHVDNDVLALAPDQRVQAYHDDHCANHTAKEAMSLISH
jgi:hypothetical protein